jgi:lipopolysaccharide transport system ATP-binding protein
MSRILAQDLVVEYPVYGVQSRSLKNTILKTATGGILARDAADRVVVRALDAIDLDLREGDRVGLVGHNGSGKSTLLRVIAGAYEPTAGNITVQGRVASMLSLWLGLDAEATGYENIYLRCLIMGLSKPEIALLTEDVAEFSELGDYLRMPMRTYSSGMALRLAFAISTTVPTDILLMDEWLSVGDENFSAKAQKRLQEYVDRAKILVLATHNMGLLDSVCNKVIRLDHGRIVPNGGGLSR